MLAEISSGLDMGSGFSRIQTDFNEDLHKRSFALINLLQLSHKSCYLSRQLKISVHRLSPAKDNSRALHTHKLPCAFPVFTSDLSQCVSKDQTLEHVSC